MKLTNEEWDALERFLDTLLLVVAGSGAFYWVLSIIAENIEGMLK